MHSRMLGTSNINNRISVNIEGVHTILRMSQEMMLYKGRVQWWYALRCVATAVVVWHQWQRSGMKEIL